MDLNLIDRGLGLAYRRLDAACGQQYDRLRSGRDYESELFIPTAESFAAADGAYLGLLEQAKVLATPDPVYRILQHHLLDFIETQRSTLQSTFEHPASYISALTNFVTSMGDKDSRSADQRAAVLLRRLGQVDLLWQGLGEILPTVGAGRLRDLLEDCRTLRLVCEQSATKADEHYRDLTARDREQVRRGLVTLGEQANAWQQTVGEMIRVMPSDVAGGEASPGIDRERYRSVLAEELGVSLDELLSWYEDEVNRTRTEMIAIAARINPAGRAPITTPLAAVELMNTYAGPCDSPEEMFARLRGYLDRAQIACREFVRLPEESCRVIPVPEQFRLTYPWGGYGGGCSRRRPLLGEVFLNDTNFRAVSDGWIKINAVHECYPGHHVQWVRATLDPLPETVKIGAKRVPLQEGMCHRTERLMEPLFAEDPYYPLAVAFRRHHTAVRIKADLYLQYFHRPESDAIALYMAELGFDYQTALGQVKSQEMQNRIGYFTCYYYGMKKLADLEQRSGYDQKTFTEHLFSLPYVSLANFEAFLQLTETDKERLLTGFPSLLQFPE